jgi:hypothetical protein
VVGTVILFGFLVIALSLYQVQVVPTENANVEFEHSQSVEDDFGELRNDILRAGSTGSAGSTQVRLGTRYPTRTLFINPPPVSGSIETEATGSIRVRNATIGEGAHPNVGRFWNTSPAFPTRSLRYDTDYNELDDTPELVYEHSVVAAEFDDAVLLRTGQTVVSDGRISLTALTGSVSQSGVEPRSVDPRAVSASDTTVPLEPVGGEITLELPTAVENASALAGRWNDALPPNATAARNVTGDGVRVTLANGSDPYRLALSEVSLDTSGETEPAYIVPVGPQNVTLDDTVTVEVRDRYNNPVRDVVTTFNGTNETTDENGRASFKPTTPGQLTARINGTGGPQYESVEFEVTETGAGDGGGGEANPIANEVLFQGADRVGGDGWNLIFNNTGDTDQEITQFRLNFYNEQGGGPGGGGSSSSGDVNNGAGNGVEFTVGGERVSLDPPVTLSAGQENILEIRNFQNGPNDWFIMTINYEDGTREQYFVTG